MKAPSFKISLGVQYLVVLLMSSLLSVFASFPASIQLVHARAASQEFTTQSAAGDLDASFGNSGKVVTDLSGNDDHASAIGIEPDGKIVVGGFSTPQGGNPDFALTRYNIDGSLDPGFGSNGKVITDFFHDKDFLRGIAIQPDGKIVAAGSVLEPGFGEEFALARYNLDGTLDASFGSGGKVVTRFPEEARAWAVALTPAGKIVIVGTASMEIMPKFALARYSADGSLDSSFGTNGIVVNTTRRSFGLAVAVQPDNKIIIAGEDGDSQNFAVFRYNANGSPDTSFGTAGQVTSDCFLLSRAHAVALQPDGKIIVAGFGQTSFIKDLIGVERLNPNGSSDGTFGTFLIGCVRTSISPRNDRANALAIQSNGHILAAGLAGDPGEFFGGPPRDFGVVRYKPRGKLDNSFGASGSVITDFFGGADEANAIALQADGKIVLAGTAQSVTNDFAVARYLVEDFALRFDPPAVNANRGTIVSVDLLIDHIGGFRGSVMITSPDFSAIDVTLKSMGQIVTTHIRRTLKLKIKPSAPVGVHSLLFRGQDEEGKMRSGALTLIIND